MPATRVERARVKARTLLPWRLIFGNRTVRRHVQGVDLYLPWSHVLPDYARARPSYGQNLIELAERLVRHDHGSAEFQLVDIGANIGDSALQVLNRVNGRALCVEGDAYWARYLRMNVGSDPRVVVEEVMLGESVAGDGAFGVVREHGTSSFVPTRAAGEQREWLSLEDLRDRTPAFADVRLIKSDTDGFDPWIVPAAARAWSQSSPVLFFEFDPALARGVTGRDPNDLWSELIELGYSRLAIWDNTGDPLGQIDLSEASHEAAILEQEGTDLGYSFWDVAARRTDDSRAAAAFDELISSSFDPGS